MTQINSSTVLITGADGGIGKALVLECLRLGAKKIYATGLNKSKLEEMFASEATIEAVELDVTKPDLIDECVKLCSDTNLLINNAGVELKVPFIADKISQAAALEMQVNYIGLINMINAFVPQMQNIENSGIVNVLSIGALAIVKRLGSYCASKSAAHVLTETIREELEAKSIKIMAVYMGYVNTAMVPEETESAKSSPEEIAQGICKGIMENDSYIFPDQITKEYIRNNPIDTKFLV